jgi:hypothetical protein
LFYNYFLVYDGFVAKNGINCWSMQPQINKTICFLIRELFSGANHDACVGNPTEALGAFQSTQGRPTRAPEPCIRFGSEVESSFCRMPLYLREQTSVSMIDMSALGDFLISPVY